MNNPAIILADEPTGELDSNTGREIINLMKKINREKGKTFIVVTHNLEVAKKADRIIHLRDGRIEREERVRSELLEDLINFQNSSLGRKIANRKEVRDKDLERLRIFNDGELGKYGEMLRELFIKLQEL